MKQASNRRKLRNFLLQPFLQTRFGFYSIALSMVFAGVVFTILYINLSDFSDIVMALTDSESEVRDLFATYMQHTRWWLAYTVLLYFVANLLVSIVITHRLVGPTVAFRAHVRKLCDGKFQDRIHLRKGDAFEDLAAELNRLTAIMEKNQGKSNADP
jgi:signal transduction histidine kinase